MRSRSASCRQRFSAIIPSVSQAVTFSKHVTCFSATFALSALSMQFVGS